MEEDTFSRFTPVVENYRRYRPHYPPDLIALLQAACGLTSDHIVADIGCGTGLLAERFLQHGHRVFGVEPNPDMRAAGIEFLKAYPSFTAIDATAEATTLPDQGIDLISAGQAFHWFDPEPTRAEFERILVPGGWVVLVWNMMRYDQEGFPRALGGFWRRYIDNRIRLDGKFKHPEYITRFFEGGHVSEQGLYNRQVCDYEAFRGRVLSSSPAPQQGDPRYQPMLDEVDVLWEQYHQDGTVTLEYDTRVVYGQLQA